METIACIKTRRSTRRYKNQQVEKEKILRIVDAGRFAPSGGNSQTTHMVVITNRGILDRLAAEVQTQFAAMEVTPGMYRSMENSIRASKTGHYIYDYHAPVLIVTANRKDYGNTIADCACVLENMMLAANELDLGSCWINQLRWLNENEAIRKILHELGMKEDERVYGALALGYPDTDDGLPLRTPLERKGNPVTYID